MRGLVVSVVATAEHLENVNLVDQRVSFDVADDTVAIFVETLAAIGLSTVTGLVVSVHCSDTVDRLVSTVDSLALLESLALANLRTVGTKTIYLLKDFYY